MSKMHFTRIKKDEFHKLAECYRELSASIMNDADIVKEFNLTTNDLRRKVQRDIKTLEVQRDREFEQQFVLMIVDIQILAGEYNVDPAVVCCIGACANNHINEYIQLIEN